MVKVYPAIFHYEDNGYWVEFPDFPCCVSQGDSIDEALTEAADALGGTLAAMLDEGIEIPPASRIQDVSVEAEGFVSLVAANPSAFLKRTKAVKKTLTIPEWLNDAAEKRHINFSAVLQQALIAQIQ